MSINYSKIEQLRKDLESESVESKSDVIDLTQMDGDSKDHRLSERIQVLHQMNIEDPQSQKILDSHCINMSMTGVLLYAFEGDFDLDQIYNIFIKASQNTPDFTIQARLVRILSDEKLGNKILGLKLKPLTPEQEKWWKELMG
jgi:hypothetical protein